MEGYTTMPLPLDQQEILLRLPALIIGATMKADSTGFFAGFREANAGAQFLDSAVERFKDNVIVLELLAAMEREHELPGDLDEITYDVVYSHLEHVKALIGGSPYAAGFYQFIYELAMAVAQASGGGLFGGGNKITEGEADFLQALQEQLGLE
jgi:hypothetical protein